MIYAVITTNELGEVTEVEFFSERPYTPWVSGDAVHGGGDRTNWPEFYLVFEGNLDAGDSILIETHDGLAIPYPLDTQDGPVGEG